MCCCRIAQAPAECLQLSAHWATRATSSMRTKQTSCVSVHPRNNRFPDGLRWSVHCTAQIETQHKRLTNRSSSSTADSLSPAARGSSALVRWAGLCCVWCCLYDAAVRWMSGHLSHPARPAQCDGDSRSVERSLSSRTEALNAAPLASTAAHCRLLLTGSAALVYCVAGRQICSSTGFSCAVTRCVIQPVCTAAICDTGKCRPATTVSTGNQSANTAMTAHCAGQTSWRDSTSTPTSTQQLGKHSVSTANHSTPQHSTA